MTKKKFFCERLTTEELKNVGGKPLNVDDPTRGGTDLGGPTSGGIGGNQYCTCVCACAPVNINNPT